MICKDCALGADLVTRYNQLMDTPVAGFIPDEIVKVIEFLHKTCHNSCDCQHHVALGVNLVTHVRPKDLVSTNTVSDSTAQLTLPFLED